MYAEREDKHEITIFISGVLETDNEGEPCAAGGVWFGPGDERNKPIGISDQFSTRNSGELAAILHVIQTTPPNLGLNFRLKSKHVIRKLTIDVVSSEASGWTGDKDKTLLTTIVAALRVRGSQSSFCEVTNNEDLEKVGLAKSLALAALGDYSDENTTDPDDLLTTVPHRYQLQGISLAQSSQALFYRAIRERKAQPERMKTCVMLDITRYAVKDQCGKTPSDEQIWKSIRDKDITRTIRDFLWRGLHQSYKCGTYWHNIPGYEHWGICHTCQVDETLEHILLECSAPGQDLIWKLARELWEKKHRKLPTISLGMIFGCGLAEFKDTKGKEIKEADRLFKIIISESAHMIWKLRNDRVISNHVLSDIGIHNKWVMCMNKRLRMDQLLTDISRYGTRATSIECVLQTWDGVLMDNQNLPENWIWQSGVLVGMGMLRPPGRNR
ncbi:ribonuclease H-like protein [Mycena crocata]|nr:ribonuclease H-like protein [Mycena crocata]